MPEPTQVRSAWEHRVRHGIDQRVVLQNFVDPTKPWIHLLLGLEIPESKRLPESALPVATTKHPDFQTAQISRDEKKLAKATQRERRVLIRSIDERRAGTAK